MPHKPIRNPEVEGLLSALVDLHDKEQAFALLEDLCTPREILEMAQRLTVARMLNEGSHYSEIQEKTGASATTIARVSRALNYGSGGYSSVLDERDAPADEQVGER